VWGAKTRFRLEISLIRMVGQSLGTPHASLTMIDRHYGHLARDGREHAIQLLDALNEPESAPWTLVDAAWTSKRKGAVGADNRSAS
jgi:hypothetical protein